MEMNTEERTGMTGVDNEEFFGIEGEGSGSQKVMFTTVDRVVGIPPVDVVLATKPFPMVILETVNAMGNLENMGKTVQVEVPYRSKAAETWVQAKAQAAIRSGIEVDGGSIVVEEDITVENGIQSDVGYLSLFLMLKRRALLSKVAERNENVKLESKLRRPQAERLCDVLQFEKFWSVDRVGMSGGLLLLWKNVVQLRVDSRSSGHITTIVMGKGFLPWNLTCFFGNPDSSQRHFSWELLQNIRDSISGPWLCVGDFNEITSISEKVGGRDKASSELTWYNGHEANMVMERLDRGLCPQDWLSMFDGANIMVLDWGESDHRGLVVDMPTRDSEGRKKNDIKGMFDQFGFWQEDKIFVQNIIENYYSILFSSSDLNESVLDTVLDVVPRRDTNTMNAELEKPFQAKEVTAVVKEMAPTKAPSMDGLPTLFYQKFWSKLSGDVIAVCLNILNNKGDVSCLNDAIIAMILKVEKPKKVEDYRPISLGNVIYKNVSKCLANRLRPTLGKVISESQSAFVKGRLIHDNVIICFETLHTMRKNRFRNGSKLPLKLDMAKAYDRVEWHFIDAMMKRLGLIWEKEIILRGYRWRVDDGSMVRVLEDPWLSRPHTFKIYDKPYLLENLRVVDLFLVDGSWDTNFIKTLFNEEDVAPILSMSSGEWSLEDKILWYFNKNGEYSIRSRYKMVVAMREEALQSDSSRIEAWWKSMWRRKIPLKVKNFVWKLCHSWLPTNYDLSKRGIQVEPLCSQCSKGKRDDIIHALWGRSYSVMEANGNMKQGGSGREKARWCRPKMHCVKVNVDAGLREKEGYVAVSCVVRGHEGKVSFATAKIVKQRLTSLMAKLLAIKERFKVGIQRGFHNFMVESECLRDVQLLQLLHQIRLLMQHPNVSDLSFVYKEANHVAPILANQAFLFKVSICGLEFFPLVFVKLFG
uniref:Reverse transcriptase n=1 Tax=Cannabis sativa TaxID=3483 RepID=A0A803PU27_CANSA